MAIAHGFAQSDYVRYHTGPFMRPPVFARAAESALNLIGNIKAPRRAYLCHRLFNKSGRRIQQALVGEGRTDQDTRKLDTGGGELVDRGLHRVGVVVRQLFRCDAGRAMV